MSPYLFERVVSFGEILLLALVALWAVCLHVSVLFTARGLWRDEANTVNLAQSRSFFEMFDKMAFDSSGLAWLSVVRGWSALGLDSDFALRGLGFMVGATMVGALIWSSRKLGVRVPLLAVGLCCVGPNVVTYGDSLRAYGCATCFVLLTAGSVFELSTRYTRARTIAAGLAGIAAVHSAFPSTVLIVACYAGGAAVAIRERRTKELTALAVAAFGTLASLAVYYPTSVRVADWIIIKKKETGWSAVSTGLGEAIGFGQPWSSTVATMLPLTVIVAAGSALLLKKHSELGSDSRKAVFILTAAAFAVAGQLGYFMLLSYDLYPWHYLPIFGLLCLLADAGLHVWFGKNRYRRIVRMAAVALYALVLAPLALETAQMRRTNIDTIAAGLGSAGSKDDLIVVHPFYYGISFSRYYAGKAPWTTLPQIADHSLHRWDLIKEKMEKVAPEEEVIRKVESTLMNGHRVWLVGIWVMPSAAHPGAARLPPAPYSKFGWDEFAYQRAWATRLGEAVGTAAARLRFVRLNLDGPVSDLENVRLAVAEPLHGVSP